MNEGNGMGWGLVLVGLVLLGIGLLWVFAPPWLRPGRLPGDLVIERGGTRIYLPIMTCVVLSILLSVILWLVRWLSGPSNP